MRIILYIISYTFMIIGLTFILLYINLFSFGYTMIEYLEFIFTNIECLLFFIGFIILLKLLWR
jgi:hypothetical protein